MDDNGPKFPSLLPNKRMEMMQLQQNLKKEAEEIRKDSVLWNIEPIVDLSTDDHTSIGERIMALVQVLKLEQRVYDNALAELIRQITIDCVERGSMLQDIRQLYSEFFSAIPPKIAELQNNLVAQSALCRRLGHEIKEMKIVLQHFQSDYDNFKSNTGNFHSEASQLRRKILELEREQDDANLMIAEYNDLHRMQRSRLEHELARMHAEKRSFDAAAALLYSLKDPAASDVEQLHDKASIYLRIAKCISKSVTDAHSNMAYKTKLEQDDLHRLTMDANQVFTKSEHALLQELDSCTLDVKAWMSKLEEINRKNEGHNMDHTELVKSLQTWSVFSQRLARKFTEDTNASTSSTMTKLQTAMDLWTSSAARFVSRLSSQEQQMKYSKELIRLQQGFQHWLTSLTGWISGDDNIADEIVFISQQMESWVTKIVQGSFDKPQNERMIGFSKAKTVKEKFGRLIEDMQGWESLYEKVTGYMSPQSSAEGGVDIEKILEDMNSWRMAVNAILMSSCRTNELNLARNHQEFDSISTQLVAPKQDEKIPNYDYIFSVCQRLEEWADNIVLQSSKDENIDPSIAENLRQAFIEWSDCVFSLFDKRALTQDQTEKNENEEDGFSEEDHKEIIKASQDIDSDLSKMGNRLRRHQRRIDIFVQTEESGHRWQAAALENAMRSLSSTENVSTGGASSTEIAKLELEIKELRAKLRDFEMKEIAPAILFGIGSEKRADDPRTREGKMRKFMSSKVTQSEIRPKNWLIKFIREIYDLKFQSEPQVDVDRMFGQSNREPMPDFIFGYLTTKYGLRPLIDQQIEDLLNTVNKYRQNDSEVNIFASFMEEILSPDELAFFLHARNLAIHGITAGSKYPIDRFSTLAEYLDLIRAVEFSKTILENLHTPIDQIGLFLRAVESISVAAPSLGNSAYLTSRSLSNGESRRLSVHTQEKDQSNPKHRRVSVMELLIMLLTHLKDHQRKNAEKLVDFFKAVDGTNAGYINEEQFGKSIHTLFPDAADEVISFVFSDVVNKSTDEQASKGRMSFPTFVQAIGKVCLAF
eukprot:TRINITY_DN1482_c0_g1_i1.p1 TRINITY_DN1482_c0_g1~~TRINITY_DN1482_c0_g1_i1.p1  ORF type:complete len:1073 (-),score=191.70 TRINITY_DN1482_c0_g1_i1:859-3990(-)